MKLTLLLILFTFLQGFSATYAQHVSLTVKDESIKTVFGIIHTQTKYDFLYNDDELKFTKKISLNLKNASLKEVLDECFKGEPFNYIIRNKTILVTKKVLITPIAAPIQKTVTGKVTDTKNQGINGVTVSEKGKPNFVTTDINGNYKITVSDNATLTFTYVGFVTQDIALEGKVAINVVLKENIQDLNEVTVVAIGYGSQRRLDINGAVSSVSAKDIQDLPQVSVDQMLQGKVAGVTITQGTGAPGSAASVHIRGITSLTGSNEPLYVIDGVFIDGDANNYSSGGHPANQNDQNGEMAVSPLSLINPNDIADIQVLKDASATAIYGSRGANGVIIITTKKGKVGSAHINYDGYYGFQQQGHFLKMMNLEQYGKLENDLALLYNLSPNGQYKDPSILGQGTNWQKEVFRTAPMQSHNLSVNGATPTTNYYISGGYLKQEGTILGSDFKRYSFRSNVDGQVKEWFKLGSSISMSRTDENQGLSDNGGIIYTALLSPPDQAVYNPDGSFAGPPATYVQGTNPVALALLRTNNLVRNSINGNFYNEIRFMKDLTFRSELGGSFNFNDSRLFNPTYQIVSENVVYGNANATLNKSWQQFLNWNWKEYFTYQHLFGFKHYLQATAGYELNENNYNGISGSRQTFFSNDLQTLNLGDAKSAQNDEFKGSSVLESFYARAIYSYDSRYSITATIRSDKSSNFAPGHQTGYFPSAAFGWTLSNEKFMADVKKVANTIKLRVGYGQVGNQNIPGYSYGAALNSSVTGLGTGFNIDKYPNPTLKWETAIQTNVGLDFSLLGRVDVSVDWYAKTSKNFLFKEPLPGYVTGDANYLGGISSPYINGGKVSNKGIEFSINSHNIQSKNFTWTSTLNFTHYKNKVVELAQGNVPISASITSGYLPITVTQTTIGLPVGEFYGYQMAGLFKTADQLRSAPVQFGQPIAYGAGGTWLGDIQYVDRNHDGKIDASDQGPIGNPNPDFTYGLSNTFNYKDFELSIFLQGSYGGKILNYLNYQLEGLNGVYVNQLAEAANYWTPTNTNTNIPEPKAGFNPNLYMSTRFLQSASYLRFQNIRAGYNLPETWAKAVKLNRLKIYCSAQNVFVITGYKGLDPEVGQQNQNVFLSNIDLGRYPSPRTITFGLNAEF